VEVEFPEVRIQKAGCEGSEFSLREENLPDIAPASIFLVTPMDGDSQSWMLRSIYFWYCTLPGIPGQPMTTAAAKAGDERMIESLSRPETAFVEVTEEEES
jgi:hypothetical protein